MTTPFPPEVRLRPTGVVLAIYPQPIPLSSTEVYRAPDSGGSPDWGNQELVRVLPPGVDIFTDFVGGPGPYHYRARHIRPKAISSGYTALATGVHPVLIPGSLPPKPPLAPWTIHEDTSTRTYADTPPVVELVDFVNLEANLFQAGGVLHIRAEFQSIGTAGGKLGRVRYDGNTLESIVITTVGTYYLDIWLKGDGDANSQVARTRFEGPTGTIEDDATTSVDSTVDGKMIQFELQQNDAGDTVHLHYSLIEYLGAGAW